MKPKYFWIKERFNPQLGVYYVACGQISLKQAARFERPVYGENTMHKFDSEADYLARLQVLREMGQRIQ